MAMQGTQQGDPAAPEGLDAQDLDQVIAGAITTSVTRRPSPGQGTASSGGTTSSGGGSTMPGFVDILKTPAAPAPIPIPYPNL